jgi:hypothetical protein
MNSRRDRSAGLTKARLADAEIARGTGGETHQPAGQGADVLTTRPSGYRAGARPSPAAEISAALPERAREISVEKEPLRLTDRQPSWLLNPG